MRNLKRALSLALASVMLLGMMVVGSSAVSYPDVDDKDHVEAIEVLSAVGVIVGDNGNFRPDDKVSRNEMAVIMAKLILGTYEADSYVGSHPFTDVPEWASRYVAACYNSGIIAGRSDTTYDGGATVTAVEAAAMMLRALGYEDLSKGYAQWDQPVAAKANEINLFDGLSGAGNAAMDRDAVAGLALNALQATMVTTSRSGQDIVLPDGTTFYATRNYNERTVFTSDNWVSAIDPSAAPGNAGGYVQLGEHLYKGDLKLSKNEQDDFDRLCTKWTYKNREVITLVNEADVTYTAEVKYSDIYKDLGLSGASQTASLTIDGVPQSSITLTKTADGKLGGNGVLVQAYQGTNSQGGVTVQVTVVTPYLAQVSSYSSSKKELILKNVTDAVALSSVVTASKDMTLSSDDFDGLDAFEKDDYVLVTVANHKVQTIKAAEVVTGDVSSYVDKKNVTVSGTRYSYTKGYEGPASYKLNSEFELYMDDYGYVIYAKGVEDSDDYLYVTKGARTSGVNGGYEIKFIKTDGTEDVATVHNDSVTGNGITDGNGADVTAVAAQRWYKYEIKSGKYVLTGLDPAADADESFGGTVSSSNAADAKIVENGKTRVTYNSPSGYKTANSSTVFIVKKGDAITLYTGVNNVPDVKVPQANPPGKSATVAVITDDDGFAKYVMIDAAKDALSTSGSVAGERIFIVDSVRKQISEADGNKKLYTYEAVRTGVEEENGIISTSSAWTPGLYKDVAYDGDWVDSMTLVAGTSDDNLKGYTARALDVAVVNNALNVVGADSILADDCKVFISDGDDLTETDPAGLDAKYNETDKLTGYVWTVIDNNKVIEIYVVEDETVPAPGSDTTATVQELVVTEAKDQTKKIEGTIKGGIPADVASVFPINNGETLANSKQLFVVALNLPGTANKYIAMEINSPANKPSNWNNSTSPWAGDVAINQTTGVKYGRRTDLRGYEGENQLGVLMMTGEKATVKVMIVDTQAELPTYDRTAHTWETGEGKNAFVPTYTITIDPTGATIVGP